MDAFSLSPLAAPSTLLLALGSDYFFTTGNSCSVFGYSTVSVVQGKHSLAITFPFTGLRWAEGLSVVRIGPFSISAVGSTCHLLSSMTSSDPLVLQTWSLVTSGKLHVSYIAIDVAFLISSLLLHILGTGHRAGEGGAGGAGVGGPVVPVWW